MQQNASAVCHTLCVIKKVRGRVAQDNSSHSAHAILNDNILHSARTLWWCGVADVVARFIFHCALRGSCYCYLMLLTTMSNVGIDALGTKYRYSPLVFFVNHYGYVLFHAYFLSICLDLWLGTCLLRRVWRELVSCSCIFISRVWFQETIEYILMMSSLFYIFMSCLGL